MAGIRKGAQAPNESRPGSGSSRGSDNIQLAASLGRAIVAARGSMTQTELAERTGIDQPTISKLEKGLRRQPLTVWEMQAIEAATGRGAGFILRECGYLPRTLTARQAVAAEPNLGADARVAIIGALDAALAHHETVTQRS